MDLRIPKLRQGSFFASLLERRRRVDQALFAVVMEAYVHGVSTRKVDDLVEALGADTGISKSEVSRMCAGLDEDVAAFRDRPLGESAYPVGSAWGAVSGLLPVRFPRPPAEPDVRLSPHPALHERGLVQLVVTAGRSQGVGMW